MFFTKLDKHTAKVADLIVNEFIRLEIDTDADPSSGLMCRVPNLNSDIALVEIYDDYVSGAYDGDKVLAHLRSLSPGDVSLASEDLNNVWQSISDYEI